MKTAMKAPFTVKSAAVPTEEEIVAFRQLSREEQVAFVNAELEKGRQSGPPSECTLDDVWSRAMRNVARKKDKE